MRALVHQRCLHHAEREAVARCPECERFFCRECISEYEDRVLCTSCLSKIAAPKVEKTRDFEGGWLAVQAVAAVVVIWFFFFLVGQGLLAIPAEFHKGEIWQELKEAE